MDNDRDVSLMTQSEDNRTRKSSWKPLLDEPLRSRAQEAAFWVARRMSDPEYVQQTRKQSPYPMPRDLTHPWTAAELALFYHFVARCSAKQEWLVAAQRYLMLIEVGSQQNEIVSPSLFAGTSGIAFAIQHFSEHGRRYQRTLARLHHSLSKQVSRGAYRQKPLEGNAESDFDTITGAAGIASYLTSISSPDPTVMEVLHILLNYLCTLAEPGQSSGQERWFSPPSFLTDRDRWRYPHGRFNCGLAHGLSGPLAALALASLAGYAHPNIRASIDSASTWLIHHQLHDEWGITWPIAIPYELASSPELWRTLPASRTAWCYGSLGIARALWLAGRALNDEHLAKIALDALKTVLHRPFVARNIDTTTLCHGHAGLLLICLHFAHECHDPLLLEQIPQIVEYILSQFDPQSPFGFRGIEQGGIAVDPASLLTGTPGTALALLAASSEVAPSWDRLLLIS